MADSLVLFFVCLSVLSVLSLLYCIIALFLFLSTILASFATALKPNHSKLAQ